MRTVRLFRKSCLLITRVKKLDNTQLIVNSDLR